jgi:hypothetical protein
MTSDASLANTFQNTSNGIHAFIIARHLPLPRSIAIMNEDLSTYIIKELGKPQSRKKIVRNVCQRSGLVESQQYRKMAGRQAPPLLFLSIAILLSGMGLLGLHLQELIVFIQHNLPGQALNLQSSEYHWTALLTGTAMTIAGLIGLWKAYGKLFSA